MSIYMLNIVKPSSLEFQKVFRMSSPLQTRTRWLHPRCANGVTINKPSHDSGTYSQPTSRIDINWLYIFFVINKPKRSQEHELLTRHKTLAPSWGFLTIVITLPSSAVTVAHIKPGTSPQTAPVPGGPCSSMCGKVCFFIIRSIIRMMSSCATSWSSDEGRYFSTHGSSAGAAEASSATMTTSMVDIPILFGCLDLKFEPKPAERDPPIIFCNISDSVKWESQCADRSSLQMFSSAMWPPSVHCSMTIMDQEQFSYVSWLVRPQGAEIQLWNPAKCRGWDALLGFLGRIP